jgi:photosystem II stability/assembly factor-like uncharacterized protein
VLAAVTLAVILNSLLGAFAQPTVTTLPASSVTSTSATLNGTVNPNGTATEVYFSYGFTTSYDSLIYYETLPATNTAQAVAIPLGGLAPGTTYYYQLAGLNTNGLGSGANQTFTTSAGAPTATSLPGTSITTNNATLNGSLTTGGLTTAAWFRYGFTTNYGSFSATNTLPGTNTVQLVSNLIGNLRPGAYHFQLVASNSAGGNAGADLTFTTPLANPYGQAVLADYPIGYWRLDETNGIVARDFFGANNGAYTNTLLGQAGNTNVDSHTAVKFGSVSSSNSYVGAVPIGFAAASNASFSVECWANGGPQTTGSGLIAKGAGTAEQFTLDCGSVNNAFRFFVRDAAGGAHVANGTITPGNAWHHLVGVCDQAYGQVILYVDGVSNASGAITAGSGLRGSTNATAFGARQSGAGAYDLQFVGSLEEVAIYTNALSAARVLAHYQGAYPPAHPPVVTTLPATSVTATNATLNGTINPNGAATLGYFQYGLTTNYGYLGGFSVQPATNATLSLPGVVVNSLPGAGGAHWTQTSAPFTNHWESIASSADGTRLAAGAYGEGIWTSTNSGVTWQASASANNWQSIACSADGTRLAAVIDNGGIWTSTNRGVTWQQTSASANSWRSVASSADGTVLAAVIYGGGIFVSTDGGVTWTPTSAPGANWQSIAFAAGGTRLAAVVYGGQIWTSTDTATWTPTSAPYGPWYSIASSADGMRLAAAQFDSGGIWTSTNGGVTWTQTSAPAHSWSSIASSADGMRLAAVVLANGGGIWSSADGGGTWTASDAPFNYPWQTIASSGNGMRLAAVAYGGGIWTSVGSASNLQALTTYHFQLVAGNSAGTTSGTDLTFITVGPPSASTLAASSITATNCTLNGTVNPNGAPTSAYFRYGLTTNYGSYSATNTLPATNVALSVSKLTSNLTANTTYHFQLVCTNSAGTAVGGDLSFLTLSPPPVVTTLPATSITATNATLNGSINPNGVTTLGYFQYGLTTNYGYLGGFSVLPATNATLTMPGLVVTSLSGAAGTNWTQTSAPNRSWYSMASSADGTRLAAVDWNGGIWSSTNSGVTWQKTSAPNTNWNHIASSADGTRLGAVNYGGGIWTSTDGAVTWTPTSAPTNLWNSIVSSADGLRLVASVNGGGIFSSTNGGVTWTQTSAPSAPAWFLAASAGGTRLAAAACYGGIWTSTDGATWAPTSAPTNCWYSITCSADGTRLAAGQNPGGIWSSADGGGTWTQASAPTTNNWYSIASSADGMRLAAGQSPGGIWTSTDGGGTWTASDAPSASWYALASSGDGTRLAAGVNGGGLWTSVGPASNLQPGTVYNYRLVGINTSTGWGSNLTFITSLLAPSVQTLAASSITATNATLNGTVNPNGAATTAYFRYGLTTNYGSYSATNTLPATNTTRSVSNLIGSLAPGSGYHFQLVAMNAAGSSVGADLTFTTSAGAPTVTSLPATSITASNATLNGTVNPNGAATTAYFRYGLTTNYGSYSATNTLAATNTAQSMSNLIGGLTYGMTYHFQLVCTNSAGAAASGDLSFVTLGLPPVVTTLPATNNTLNGTINPNGAATLGYFQYGLTTNYGYLGGFSDLPATNATLTMPGLVVTSLSGAAGTNWTQTSAPNHSWYSMASSADGTRLGAVDWNGGIWSSTNSGLTWQKTSAPNTNWNDIASSADGTRLGAVNYGGGIWTSTDGAVTWTPTSAPTNLWNSIVSSADGLRLVASVNGGGIFSSTNGGVTWTQTSAPSAAAWFLAASADGTRLAAAVLNGGIWTSTDGGVTWTPTSAPTNIWYSIASSADGERLAALQRNSGGSIWTSTNGGVTWTQASAPTTNNWYSIASSADGMRLAAGQSPGGIWTSTDGGGTWTASDAPSTNWYAIASSGDGTRLAAGVYPAGGIWTSVGPASNLQAGTAYNYRLVGINNTGTGLGSNRTFVALAPPTATYLSASETYTEDTPLNLINIVVSDPDSSNVTATLTLSNTNAGSLSTATSGTVTSTYNAATGVWTASGPIANVNVLLAGVTFTPSLNFNANFTIATSVTDGDFPPITGSKAMTGVPVNDPPTLNAIANPAAINEDAGLQTVNLSGITAGGGESQTLTVTATSGNTNLIPNPTITYTSPNTTGSLSYTPVANASGTALITVTVNDGGASNNITTQTFTVTVNPVNDPPTLNPIANPAAINEDAGLQTVNLSGITAGGGESQTLTITATSGNTNLIPNPTVTYTSPNATGSLSYTPVANASGTALITVTVNDGGASNNITTQTFTVTVNPVNDPPTLNAIANPAAINEDAGLQTVNLSGITAGGGESQTLTVTATSGNTNLIPNPTVTYTSPNTTGSLSYTPVANASGTALITVTVNDGGASNNITTRTFTVAVNAVNDPPTLNAIANPAPINEDAGLQTVNLSGITAGGGESQTLTVTATSGNTNLIPNPTVTYTSPNTTGSLSYTPVANASGTALITVTVNDGGASNNITTQTFTVTVNPVNDPPTLNAIANPAAINEDAGLQTVNLSGITAGGGESQTLTVTATSGNTNLIPNPTVTYTSPNTTGSLSYTPVANASGTALITVMVNDGGASNNITTRTFTVTVNPVNDPPTLNAIANPAAINEDAGLQTVNLSGITAGGGESQTLTVTATSGNTNLIPNPTVTYTSPNTTGSLTYKPLTNANGTALITVTVNDGGASNNIASRTFTVTVNPVNDMPVFTKGPDQSLPFGTTNAQTVVNWATGIDDGDPEVVQTLTFNLTNSNPAMFATPPSVSSNGTLAYTPNGTSGTATIGVSLTDDAAAGGPALTTAVQTFTITVAAATTPPPPVISSATVLSNGAFQLTFTNTNDIVFSVLGTTNLGLPASNWTVLGTTTNIGGGQHGFTDSEATNFWSRYYLLRFP